MSRQPKTAEQIFQDNVLVRVVELHLLRRKVRHMVRAQHNPGPWGAALEKLDNRIAFLTRQVNSQIQ